MRKIIINISLLCLIQAMPMAQVDTASVTYIPNLDIYLLEYSMEGTAYTDTLIPATRIDPAVECSVSDDGGVYLYSYSVSLSSASQQYLVSFMISHPATIHNATKPNSRWTQGEFAQHKVWDWSNTKMDSSGLWTPTTDVAPGDSLGGFSIRSAGLPAIVSSYFEGNAPLLAFSAEPPTKMYDLLDPILVFPNNTIIRRTLGPKDPPTPFNSINFLDTIKTYINESRSLGWITNDPTANKYTAFIDSARSNLQANRRGVTKSNLDLILQNVDADSGGTLSSEAYALLRFNTEYVMNKLREYEEGH
jgi:hypothetical protein